MTPILLTGLLLIALMIAFRVFQRDRVSALEQKNIFRPLNFIIALFNFEAWRKLGNKGAKFMSEREIKKVLNPQNQGLLIDGKESRLSLDDSFTHNTIYQN